MEATETVAAARPARSVGNLVGALAVHALMLVYAGLVVVFAAADRATSEEEAYRIFFIGSAIVLIAWAALAVIVVRWWLRGRGELWNVTLAWLTIAFLTIWLLPLLLWPRVRRWLGASFGGWEPGTREGAGAAQA